jgi:HAE1 family hydrophobic/amphiphilic exporter-1
MQWLAEICVRRPVFAWVLVLSLSVVGLFAFGRLGVDRFPNVDFPTVIVTTLLPAPRPSRSRRRSPTRSRRPSTPSARSTP